MAPSSHLRDRGITTRYCRCKISRKQRIRVRVLVEEGGSRANNLQYFCFLLPYDDGLRVDFANKYLFFYSYFFRLVWMKLCRRQYLNKSQFRVSVLTPLL
jgi:hypothetical protein